ncbi:MAG: NAD(P)H-binding protein [Pseudomonadota bacterium]
MAAGSKRIALFGATGTAGRAVAIHLAKAGHAVTAFCRQDPSIAGVCFQPFDAAKHNDLKVAFARVNPDVVISCLASRTGVPDDAWAVDHDANLALLQAAKSSGTDHFILLSAICVQKPKLAFQHAKRAFESTLIQSGLTYSIVRPTAFFKSLSGQVERLRGGRPFLLFGDGTLTACKPISDRDLARFISTCIDDPAKQDAILPVGGPGHALTSKEIGALLFDALERPPSYRSISPKVISSIAIALDLAGRLIPGLRAKAELARIGHYYATESMLLWDPETQRYDPDATPAFGTDTLQEHFRAVATGHAEDQRGAHRVF